eukprot:scaffold703_cov168-Amphora_coffeaeformis.AAC.12
MCADWRVTHVAESYCLISLQSVWNRWGRTPRPRFDMTSISTLFAQQRHDIRTVWLPPRIVFQKHFLKQGDYHLVEGKCSTPRR